MENWKVYVHINKTNKKAYFGITKQTLARRFRKNGQGYKNSPIFYKAILKYGWDNFQHFLLKQNLSQQQAIEWEKWLIQRYKTQNKKFGYNCTSGGDVVINSDLISLLNKQRWQNGIYDNIKHKVYCIELQLYFDSALQAERVLKIDNSSIQKACRGKNNYAGIKNGQPLHWLFVSDITEEKVQQLYNKKEVLKGVSIPVYCQELQQEFSSAKEASKILLIDESNIRKATKGILKTAGKSKEGIALHWKALPEKVNIGVFTGK